MATHSNVLAWRIPGMAEPGGLLSMGNTQDHSLIPPEQILKLYAYVLAPT